MKNKLFLFWILLSVVTLSVTSCSSDSDTTQTPTLLKKIQSVELGQNATYQFYYKGTKLSKVNFTIQGQTDGTGYEKYSYTNDLISEIKTYNSANQIQAITKLNYNATNQLMEVVKVIPSENYGLKTIFTYTLVGTVVMKTFSGNMEIQENFTNQTTTFHLLGGEVVKKVFQSETFQDTVEYMYDQANNPVQNITGFNAIKLYATINNGLFGLNHNLTQQTTYLTPDVVDNQIDFTLQYNNDNYPTTRFATGNFSGNYQYQYEYY